MSRNAFKAVTWNVHHSTSVRELEPILQVQKDLDVSLFLLQESGGRDIEKMLERNNLAWYFHSRQYTIAWNPVSWVGVAVEGVRLSDQAYWREGGSNEQYSEAAKVILCDRQGRSLTAVSYHTPSQVQRAGDNRPQRRYQAMIESFVALGEIAEDSLTTGFLAGGDDNWDEDTGLQTNDVTPYLLGRATGLRQIQAPEGRATHGKRRAIDDFRIVRRGALRVGPGWTFDGGGDHKGHGREFRWR